MSTPSLAELQAAFFRSIATAPGTGAPAFDPVAVGVIAPSPTLSPAERLEIYADMYFARLHDCLREDFPKVVERLGDDRFQEIVRGYLAAHPSVHPSVRHIGRSFAAHLATGASPAVPPALAELARFEWARMDAFDAPDATPLTRAELMAVQPDRWGELRFEPVPASSVFASEWAIHRLWSGEDPLDAPKRPTRVRIWRQGFAVYHAGMEDAEADALSALRHGVSFAEACEAAARACPDGEAAARVVGWLARWLEDGLFAGPLAL